MYYEISGHNVRILGSLHVFPVGDHLLPAWVQHAYGWAQILTREHDSAGLDPYRREADGVTPKHWQKYFEDVGSALGPLQHGVEAAFAARLQSEGRPEMGKLEQERAFAGLLDAVPREAFEAAAREQEQSRSDAPAQFAKFHNAWARADLVALHKVLSESPIYKIKTIREAVFIKRNRQWAKEICSAGRSQERRLYVVGCLHLIGRDNLLEMVKARGRKIVRLDLSSAV